MSGKKVIEFWFDFASTYSYLSAMRIEPLATDAGFEVYWKPFLLGPIFASQGWNGSPFNIYPAKGGICGATWNVFVQTVVWTLFTLSHFPKIASTQRV